MFASYFLRKAEVKGIVWWLEKFDILQILCYNIIDKYKKEFVYDIDCTRQQMACLYIE